MRMYNPPHPGEFIKDTYLAETELSQTEIAKRLDVNQSTLNRLIQGKASISPEMAVRLSKVLGSSPRTWLNMQSIYDLSVIDEDSIAGSLHQINFDSKQLRAQ